jgi:hypothetical protein
LCKPGDGADFVVFIFNRLVATDYQLIEYSPCETRYVDKNKTNEGKKKFSGAGIKFGIVTLAALPSDIPDRCEMTACHCRRFKPRASPFAQSTNSKQVRLGVRG